MERRLIPSAAVAFAVIEEGTVRVRTVYAREEQEGNFLSTLSRLRDGTVEIRITDVFLDADIDRPNRNLARNVVVNLDTLRGPDGSLPARIVIRTLDNTLPLPYVATGSRSGLVLEVLCKKNRS